MENQNLKYNKNNKITKQEQINLNEKVKELIQKYNHIKDNSYYELYKTLKEIFELRKKEDYDYCYEDLAREKKLDVSVASVRYIFGFEFFNDDTKRLIKEDKISARAVLWILRRNKIFRETELQDDIIQRVISGNLTISEMSHLQTDTILKRISENKKIGDDSIVFEQTWAELRRARYKIINYKTYFNKEDRTLKIINYLEEIIKELKRI